MSGPISTILPDIGLVTIPAASGLTVEDALPWLIDVDVFEQAVSHINWDTVITATSQLLNGYKQSSGALNDEINFDLVLAAGSWDLEVLYVQAGTGGIVTVSVAGANVGTIDHFAAGPIYNVRSTMSFTVSSADKKRLKLKVTSTSGAGYAAWITHIQLRRTA